MTTTNRRNRNSAELAEIVARDNEALRAYQLYEAHCNQLPQTDIDPARTRVLKRESERAVAQLFGYYESTIYRKARDMGRALFGDLDNEMHDASEAIAREAFADALRCFDMLSGREFHRFLPLVIHRAIYHQLTPTALADVSRIQCSMVVTAINVRDLLTQELGRHPTNPEILDGVLKWYLADSDHKYGGYYAKHSLTWVVRQKAALPELCGDPAKYNQMFELLARLDASVRPAVVVQHHATASLVDTRDMADALSERDLFSEVHNVLAELTPRQRASIVSSNGLAGTKPRTMSEIGADFGVSRETIRRDLLAAERLLNNKHVKARLRRAQGAVPGKPLGISPEVTLTKCTPARRLAPPKTRAATEFFEHLCRLEADRLTSTPPRLLPLSVSFPAIAVSLTAPVAKQGRLHANSYVRAQFRCHAGHLSVARICDVVTYYEANSSVPCAQCPRGSWRNRKLLPVVETSLFAELQKHVHAVYRMNINPGHGLKWEYDIGLPDLRILIEFDGRWYHRDSHDNDRRKTIRGTNAGYRVIRIRHESLGSITDDDIVINYDAEDARIVPTVVTAILDKLSMTLAAV